MALSLALKVSQSVTRIDIDKGPKKESVSDLLVYCFDCWALWLYFSQGRIQEFYLGGSGTLCFIPHFAVPLPSPSFG